MSSPRKLSFRDSLDTVAGQVTQEPTQSNETTSILSESRQKSVKFINDPVFYYYHPDDSPSKSIIRSNYSIISTETPSVYLNDNEKKGCRWIIYIVPVIIFVCFILLILLLIFIFYH
jgi:hypothetical protein